MRPYQIEANFKFGIRSKGICEKSLQVLRCAALRYTVFFVTFVIIFWLIRNKHTRDKDFIVEQISKWQIFNDLHINKATNTSVTPPNCGDEKLKEYIIRYSPIYGEWWWIACRMLNNNIRKKSNSFFILLGVVAFAKKKNREYSILVSRSCLYLSFECDNIFVCVSHTQLLAKRTFFLLS